MDHENDYGMIIISVKAKIWQLFLENTMADQLDMNIQQMDDEVDIVMNEAMGDGMIDVNNEYWNF